MSISHRSSLCTNVPSIHFKTTTRAHRSPERGRPAGPDDKGSKISRVGLHRTHICRAAIALALPRRRAGSYPELVESRGARFAESRRIMIHESREKRPNREINSRMMTFK